jgi:ABC-type transporter Mla subunit MlaD
LDKLSNELKIGLVVLAATLVAYIGFRIMKNQPFFSNAKVLHVKYESVEGLIKGSDVTIGGLSIGAVKQLEYLVEEDSIEVIINIKNPVPIPVGSKALLESPAVLGSAKIAIIKSDQKELVEWGSYIEGTKEAGLLDSFSEKGSSLADSVGVTVDLANQMLRKVVELQDGNKNEISNTVSNFEQTSQALREIIDGRQKSIDSMIVDTRATMKTLRTLSDSSSEDLESMIANLEAFTSELEVISEDLKSSSQSITSILSKIDAGEGTVGLMVNDPSLYQNMDSLTVNLNELIKGIQEDPRRYLKHMRLVEIF